jgi:hypothetical protein
MSIFFQAFAPKQTSLVEFGKDVDQRRCCIERKRRLTLRRRLTGQQQRHQTAGREQGSNLE